MRIAEQLGSYKQSLKLGFSLYTLNLICVIINEGKNLCRLIAVAHCKFATSINKGGNIKK